MTQIPCMCAKLLQSCPTLCDPMDCSPPGSSVRGDSPGKSTGVGAMPFSRGSFQSRDRTHISYISGIARQVLYHLAPPGKAKSDWGRAIRRKCNLLVLPITTSMHSSLSQNYITMYFSISSNVSEEDARLFAATEL